MICSIPRIRTELDGIGKRTLSFLSLLVQAFGNGDPELAASGTSNDPKRLAGLLGNPRARKTVQRRFRGFRLPSPPCRQLKMDTRRGSSSSFGIGIGNGWHWLHKQDVDKGYLSLENGVISPQPGR